MNQQKEKDPVNSMNPPRKTYQAPVVERAPLEQVVNGFGGSADDGFNNTRLV